MAVKPKIKLVKTPEPQQTVPWNTLPHEFAGPLQHLQRLLAADRLPATILFHGYEGSGKRRFLNAASALHLCEVGSACGLCSACLMVAAGQHPDVLRIDTDGLTIKVADIERVEGHLGIHPSARHETQNRARRIVQICDVDLLTVSAVNKLLKLTEEPPRYAQIYFSTSRRAQLLPTLLSRCIAWPLPAPSAVLELGKNHRYRALLECRDCDHAIDLAQEMAADPAASLVAMLRELDYALNGLYREQVKQQSAIADRGQLLKRRALLHRLKQRAGREKIAINSRLALEQIGDSLL